LRLLADVLREWDNRQYKDDEIIKWARSVYEEYNKIDEGVELNQASLPESLFNPVQILELIKTRRSVRRWKESPIPQNIIEKILEAGRWAPSACNRQSCRFIVLNEELQKKLLTDLREDWLKYAPTIIFIGSDKRNYLPVEYDYVPYMDAAVATENMLLMAHALGLGATMVKCTGWDLLEGRSHYYSGKIINMYEGLNLPKYFIPVAIVALGYPERIPKAPARLSSENTCFYERYDMGRNEYVPHSYSDLIDSDKKTLVNVHATSTKELCRIVAKRILKKFANKIGL